MTDLITLSRFKAMSAQDLASALEAGQTISVEVGGQHLFDVVQPLNALDEQFLTISRYVGREVASEFKRKIESMRVEDMFDSRNVQSVLSSVASTINARGAEQVAKAAKPAAAPVAEKKPAPAKRKAAEKAAAPAEKKPAARTRPSRAKANPAPAPAAAAELKPRPAARPETAAPAVADADLDLEPFPQDLNEDLVASEAPLANTVHDGLDSDPYPENDHDAEEFFADTLAPASNDPYEHVPDDELFADLKEMELTPEEIAAEDEEDDDFSDGPIVRRIVRGRA